MEWPDEAIGILSSTTQEVLGQTAGGGGGEYATVSASLSPPMFHAFMCLFGIFRGFFLGGGGGGCVPHVEEVGIGMFKVRLG